MDKFGIFKLLTSFFDFYTKSKNPNGENTTSTFPDLTKLFGGTNNEKPSPPTASPPPEKKPTPLQSQMLYTMQNHNQVVARVKNKTPK